MTTEPWRLEVLQALQAFGPIDLLLPDLIQHSTWPDLADYTRWASQRQVVNFQGLPVQFAKQPPKRGRRRRRREANDASANSRIFNYEQAIYECGAVATRPRHWHDLFNAMVWCMFPRSKAALNARQVHAPQDATEHDKQRQQVRTREQDRLTMFDEGGVIVTDAGEPLAFGHAIYEQLVIGKASIHALALPVKVPKALDQCSRSEALTLIDSATAELILNGVFRLSPHFASVCIR